MTRSTITSRLTLAVSLAVGSALLLASVDATARERPAGAQRPAQHGDFTRQTQRQRTENGRTRSDTWTNSQGKTASRDVTVVNDKEAGVRTRDVTMTGPNGNTATRHDVTTKTENGYTRDSTFTNPQGKTITREATVVNDKEAGTRSRDVEMTLPDGRTRSISDVTQRTEDGYTRSTTITNPNGGTLQRDVVATRDPETGEITKEVTVDRTPPAAPPGG